ncbi:MAG: radical SAM family heme chaperone HemW [Cyclobacteriaceae bacterium]|nr:radical SAM family heme chaperone HemW [Cyclobacteriaceae bacterium]
MAGIYVHIPFCRQACHYCDFHFSTYHKLIRPVLEAIGRELHLRQDYLQGAAVETIYFGGGTPSLLNPEDLQVLLDQIYEIFPVPGSCEITLESNPDDLNKKKVRALRSMGINRLSIGAQTFHDEYLTYLNRVHTAEDIKRSFFNARECGFDNINLDLIYAIRENYTDMLKKDLVEIGNLRPEHISAYCLTIEPVTVFGRWLDKSKIPPVPDHEAAEQFEIISEHLGLLQYDHYEISNFALPGYFSRHNTNYWMENVYLGIGPSAHSYNLKQRQHNLDNNSRYIKSLTMGNIPATIEYLSIPNRINERILTGLRTSRGCDLNGIRKDFGVDILGKNGDYIQELADKEMVILTDGIMKLNRKGMLFADRIASDLFVSEGEI